MTMWKVYAVLSFLAAHRSARGKITEYFLADSVFDKQVQQVVFKESKDQCDKAEELLQQLEPSAVQQGSNSTEPCPMLGPTKFTQRTQ